jgi:cytochrome c biogenesis protein CcdA
MASAFHLSQGKLYDFPKSNVRLVHFNLNVQLVLNFGVFPFIQTSLYCRICVSVKPLYKVVYWTGVLGVVKLPLPGVNVNAANLGSYGVGLTFGLVSSPCASPVLFAVLAAAAATGSQLLGTLTMICYALGYTIVIFLASLLTGFAKQAKTLMQHSESII